MFIYMLHKYVFVQCTQYIYSISFYIYNWAFARSSAKGPVVLVLLVAPWCPDSITWQSLGCTPEKWGEGTKLKLNNWSILEGTPPKKNMEELLCFEIVKGVHTKYLQFLFWKHEKHESKNHFVLWKNSSGEDHVPFWKGYSCSSIMAGFWGCPQTPWICRSILIAIVATVHVTANGILYRFYTHTRTHTRILFFWP